MKVIIWGGHFRMLFPFMLGHTYKNIHFLLHQRFMKVFFPPLL